MRHSAAPCCKALAIVDVACKIRSPSEKLDTHASGVKNALMTFIIILIGDEYYDAHITGATGIWLRQGVNMCRVVDGN